MNQDDLIEQFDQWAQSYDQELVTATDRFPFAGYSLTLKKVLQQAAVEPGMDVLDLGIGTGNLSRLFLDAGCRLTGVDFSSEMLAKAAIKLPQAELIQADLTLTAWPAALNRRFERIVSNYVFHEFPLEMKIEILTRLARNNLANGGRIVIGDIIFPTSAHLERSRAELGDRWEEEYYWSAAETREVLERAGWSMVAIQVSFCAGVLVLQPPGEILSSGDLYFT